MICYFQLEKFLILLNTHKLHFFTASLFNVQKLVVSHKIYCYCIERRQRADIRIKLHPVNLVSCSILTVVRTSCGSISLL